jgi:hypothetical protein
MTRWKFPAVALWSITNYLSKNTEGKNTHSQKLDYSSSSTVEIY